MNRTSWKIVVAPRLVVSVLLALGGLSFIYSGVYNVAATEGHTPPVKWVLETTQDRSCA
jgi:hypothetical protein